MSSPGNNPAVPKQSMLSKAIGSGLGYGFIGLDTYMRVQDGEHIVPAVAKAALTNAFWMAVPGGLATMVGFTAATMLPQFSNMMDQATSGISAKKKMFAGSYAQNEAQQMMLQDGVNRLMENRKVSISRHAMRHRKFY